MATQPVQELINRLLTSYIIENRLMRETGTGVLRRELHSCSIEKLSLKALEHISIQKVMEGCYSAKAVKFKARRKV